VRIGSAPTTVRGAGVIVCLQGLAGVGFAVVLLVRAIGGGSSAGNNVFGEAGYFAVISGGVLACGIGLLLGRQWARSPAVVVELLLLGVAWYAIGPSGQPLIGVPVAVVSVAVLFLVFTERSREWAMQDPDDAQHPTND
jgi:hypothetical protein